MKKINFKIVIYIILGLAAVFALDYFLLRNTVAEDEHNHEEHAGGEKEKEESSSAAKEVELNEAQFKAANIELGTFAQKNLSEVVNANGYTELPPQNQADVSVHVTGVVSRINVIEGQQVRKGQVLATVESPEFARLQESYITSKSNLEFLKLEFERQKTLSEENVNSKKVFQRTKADYETEKARFASLGKQLSLMNLSSSSATGSMPLVAPISGSVTNINIKIGSNAEVGKPLLSIVDNSKLHVDLLVYEKDLGKVKPGQTVRFVLTNQDNTEIKGRVFNISQSFENDTKSVAVHAEILNPGTSLIPGMYVNALIDVGAKPVNALPADAVVRAEGREYIFILEEGHKEESHDEKEGHDHGDGHGHEDAHDEKEGHAHDDGHAHEDEGNMFHFQRIEVKTGTSQLGFVQVTPLQEIPKDAKIVLKGAYYIQSHLIKSAGGGGHAH
ncbi:MAG: efflux RND transporter periplasmic adaptor subunit [Flavobacterium sp.]|jgi:cobalt-zinc-cadmium efflux system membrane fusion protein|uniref:efflux RND transporter periplasmic adaptor subunit n=1 Tax=Flavobacterium sp. J372 TaxID=2898436 RepID=UPI0021512B21|nr:efflux RND transporter periplasmic adaptor subunit [Flavobacterium sp. J372]MCR5862595.1 efflux RND transporter periplasmic adaptor subunit [Flavobacterium sp. J372]MDC7218177.1 efflux RND transporter periplasmic adaptor subunit [Spirochaetales bacterium]